MYKREISFFIFVLNHKENNFLKSGNQAVNVKYGLGRVNARIAATNWKQSKFLDEVLFSIFGQLEDEKCLL